MRRPLLWLVGVLVLAAAGFAFASITTGNVSAQSGAETSTLVQTSTVTVTETRTVVRTARVTICHRTGRRSPFAVTKTVSAGSLFGYFRHGDLPGRCTAAKIRLMKRHR